MPMETFQFTHGTRTYRIQFQIVSPPPIVFRQTGFNRDYGPKPQHTVAGIRIVEITDGTDNPGQRKTLNFNRGFDTLGQARTRAGDYARRIVREQMTPKPAPSVQNALGV